MTTAREIVLRLYEIALNREPLEAELHNWSAQINNLDDVVKVLGRFASSSEYKDKNRVVPGHKVGHFYSPIVDPSQVESFLAELPRDETAIVPGIDLNIDRQEELWRSHISNAPRVQENRWKPHNGYYDRGDAFVMTGIFHKFRPRRVVEIGSGFSSARMLDIIDAWQLPTEVTFIEPYPDRLDLLLRDADRSRHQVINEPVQAVQNEVFRALDSNDILFVDSSHVLKAGSDVYDELFRILPLLRPGVVIHFHDIFWPFEYPSDWILNRRYSWNEVYAVRLLLTNSSLYKILFFNDAFRRLRNSTIRSASDYAVSEMLPNPGGGLWIQKQVGDG